MRVREARQSELTTVATILDAAMLETNDLRARVGAGDVLVAVEGRTETERESVGDVGGTSGPDRVLGALVIEPPSVAPEWARTRGTAGHVAAVAVRRRRRGRGIGTTLVDAAASSAESAGPLTAGFDAGLRSFYEGLGFEIVAAEKEERLRGLLREQPPLEG